MFDLVKCLLRYSFYQARLMGVINFDIDVRTGRARITRGTTVYVALVNMLTFAALPWIATSEVIHSFWRRAGKLHENVFLFILGGCISCVISTLIHRWSHRRDFVRLVNVFQRLAVEKPQVMRLLTRGVISKSVSYIMQTMFQLMLSLVIFRETYTVEMAVGIAVISVMTIQASFIISQYYFALLNVHGHYLLLNEELRLLLVEAYALQTEHRKGTFMIKCCALADQLDAIAVAQYHLQSLINQISLHFEQPIMFILTSGYMTSVGLIYFIFSELKSSTIQLAWSSYGLVIIALEFVLYFTDLHIVFSIIYALIDAHELMKDLVSQHVIMANGLDVRLELAFERFKLQLAWHKLKISVLGLFYLKKSNIVSMGNSVLANSFVLMQYDLQHSQTK